MKGAQNSMTGDVKATHLSRRLQVIADQILLGGRCAIEERSSEPAHAQEQVGEAQVEKRTNLGKRNGSAGLNNGHNAPTTTYSSSFTPSSQLAFVPQLFWEGSSPCTQNPA